MEAKDFLTSEEQTAIVNLIQEVEQQASCEIRVHLENRYDGKLQKRVKRVFKELKMQKTAHRNGILFYFSTYTKEFYVFGDKGIYAKLPATFWEKIKEMIVVRFKEEAYAQGILDGIQICGKELTRLYPLITKKENELSNEISFGK